MTVKELKEQLECMPDDYNVVVSVYDHDFDTELKEDISVNVFHKDNNVLIYGMPLTTNERF